MTNEACVSFAQRRFLFLHQLEQGSPTYNVPFAFLVHGPLYPFALERAFNRVVARHAALRTAFRFESAADEAGEAAPDEPRQYWPDQLYVPLQVDDLSSLPAEQRLAAARELAREEGRRLFDLAVPPLFRLRLLRLDPQQHVLLLTVQHAIIDEWSSEVLFRELDALYEDENGGQEADLPELAAQYADFARWQAGWLAGEPVGGAVSPVERQLAFWTERLSGAPAALELPTDAPRPAQATFRGGMAFHQLDAELAGRLLKLAAAERVTLFSAGLAAFAVFLSRSSAQADLVIGSPIANRSRAEFRHLVGVFLNTLALRFDLKDDPSFSELLRRTGRMMLDSFGHQDLPLERLVEALNPPRDAGRHPLFQAAFVLQPASNAGLRLGEAQVEPLKIDYGWSKFDLTLFVSQRRAAQPGAAAGQGSGGAAARTGALDLRLEYAADLFTPDSAQRMLARFETLLRSALDRPDLPVSRLAMLTPGELAFELQDCSRSARPYPRQSSIPAQFREAAARFAAAPALEFGQVCLTYAELDRRAGRLAQRLAQLGVRRGSLVGLAMERSAAMVVGMLGILQAGGAYVPLDPSYPAERLAFMAGDSELRLLVHGAGSPGLPLEGVITVSLDESGEPVDGPVAQGAHSLDGPGELPGPEDPAYLMYTSGSTGQPKGILVPQRAVLRLVLGADYCQVQPGERIAQASNMSFDAATFEVWGALLNGACLVGFPQQVVLAPAEYARWIREKRIDHLFVTTALFNLVAALQPEAFATAQTVMVGGEAVSPAMMRQVLRAGRPRRLMNIYGPTENTTFSTWQPVDDVPEQAASIPIGRPVANTSAYVLDAARQPLPVGVPGELYLGGDGLASGYWRRPELTAEKFVPNPFPEQPGVRYSPRLYRTGDRVLRRPGGEIEFLERIDTQVKLRGFRIELGEIERALLDQPEVRQAAAVLRDDPQVGKRLVAYLVLEVSGVDAPGEPAAAPVEALRGRLAQRLPAYMLPAALVALPALPVDANGKLDRRALAALPPPGRDGAGPAAGRPAQDELEAALCRLWAETLGAAAVGVDDDFFALGGHSLLAVRLFQRVEKSFGVRLPLAGLFARPTVEHMAQQLRAALQPDGEPGGAPQARQPLPTLVTIQPGEGRPVFFCVHNFGGAVLDLQPLSQAIGADQPFYGLQARGLEGECDPHTTIEEMAADYLAAVRQQQPHGPYYLGGFCFGGVVAYEMAMRLQALGEPVALLAAIDAYAPGWSRIDSPLSPAQAVAFFTNLPHWLHNYRELAPWERRVVVRRRWKRVTAGLRRLLGKPAELTTLEIIGEHTHVLEAPDYRRRLMELHLQALQAYHTPRYDGTVTVYRVRGMPLFTRHRFDLGWGRVARQVELKIVPGAHHNLLFQPYVDGLGAAIRQSIDEN